MRINDQYVFKTKTECVNLIDTEKMDITTKTVQPNKPEQKSVIVELNSSDLLVIDQEPENWQDVKELPELEKSVWINAMNIEMKNLKEANVWTPSAIPLEEKPITARWVYKIKRNDKGEVKCIKARLVARGFMQKYGENYYETYAPVVQHTTIRILLTLIGTLELKTKHCDINGAFLYGELEEDVYLKSIPGPWEHNVIQGLKLNKAIYGLKQAARQWHKRIDYSLSSFGMVAGKADKCLYYLSEDDGSYMYVLIHVDDLLIAATSDNLIHKLVTYLNTEYKIKDLGTVSCYLGIYVTANKQKKYLEIHQKPLIMKLIQELGLENGYNANTPMTADYHKFNYEDQSPLLPDNHLFQRCVGSLLYIGLVTRPDILLSTNLMGRVVSRPTQAHWNELKRIIRYLKGTMEIKLQLGKEKINELQCYSDADWGGELSDRKSTSGYCLFLGENLVHWGTKKQCSVALSTTEAEYIALSIGVQELLWLKLLLKDFHRPISSIPHVWCDNQSAIAVGMSESLNQRTKHVSIRYHFVKDEIINGNIDLKYCPSEKMLADIFTKPLQEHSFKYIRNNLGII